MTSSNTVVRNALVNAGIEAGNCGAALNAKFFVGDLVKVGPGKMMSGKTGIIKSIGKYPLSGETRYDVKFDDGGVADWREEDLVKNAEEPVQNAKFKVGDKVRAKWNVSGFAGKVGKVIRAWKDSVGTDYITVDHGGGNLQENFAGNYEAANSVAENAVKLGDKVKVMDGPFNGADGVVEKVDGGNVTVDLGGGLKTKVAMGNIKALNAEEPKAENAYGEPKKFIAEYAVRGKPSVMHIFEDVMAPNYQQAYAKAEKMEKKVGTDRFVFAVRPASNSVAENASLTKQDIEAKKSEWRRLINQVKAGVFQVKDDPAANGGAAYSLLKFIRQAEEIIPSV